jgi:hypothetical protein
MPSQRWLRWCTCRRTGGPRGCLGALCAPARGRVRTQQHQQSQPVQPMSSCHCRLGGTSCLYCRGVLAIARAATVGVLLLCAAALTGMRSLELHQRTGAVGASLGRVCGPEHG